MSRASAHQAGGVLSGQKLITWLGKDDPDSLAFIEPAMGDRCLAMAPEEDDGRRRATIESTNAAESVFFLLAQLTRDFRGERRGTAATA